MRLKHLFYDGELAPNQDIQLPKDLSRRLDRVMRLKAGHFLGLFNGDSGLLKAEILDDKCSQMRLHEEVKPWVSPQKMVLMVALVKKDAMDRIYRQATEFGVTHIQPVITDFTVVDKVNEERVRALLIEATEQCERLDVPKILNPLSLNQVVNNFDGIVFWCNEAGGGVWGQVPYAGDAVLIGPEGGFSDKEREMLAGLGHIKSVGLGPHILRADTAVAAACAIFLNQRG